MPKRTFAPACYVYIAVMVKSRYPDNLAAKVSALAMGCLINYRRHVSGERPIALLLLVLKIFQVFRLVCLFLAALFLAYGVWVALTVDMGLGGSMALIIFPVGAIVISMVGVFAYGLAQLLLAPVSR